MLLGVNIDHVATLRQQRHTIYPSPLQAALIAERAGADLITLHLREDRRHILDHDVFEIRKELTTRMNLECAITQEMLDIACEVNPQDVCLVPERRQELTTEGGLDVITHEKAVANAIEVLHKQGIEVSLFIDPTVEQIQQAHALGARVVELHTGAYADATTPEKAAFELERIKRGVEEGLKLGIKVNAGHGLHYDNAKPIIDINGIQELNIGHAIVAHAIFVGFEEAVRQMKALMR